MKNERMIKENKGKKKRQIRKLRESVGTAADGGGRDGGEENQIEK